MLSYTFFFLLGGLAQSALGNSKLETHVDSLELESDFDPVILSEFMSNPHHQRTPFAVSPDGKSSYVAYLEGSSNVQVQKVSLDTFKKDGNVVTINGAMEASGLVAHDDGFALLTHFNMTQNGPDEYWTPTVVRYKDGKQAWSTPVGGKSVTFNMFPDTKFRANKGSLDGDLKFGGNGTYAAFFRAEYYGGSAAGHGGDSIVYLSDDGSRIDGKYSQTQHCGHNFGIALSTSKSIPFAAVCTSDDGKISIASSTADEMPTIGKSHPEEMYAAEAFGGTRGSYSDMARIGTGESYLLTWVSRPDGGSEHDTRIVRTAQLSAKDTVGHGPNDVTQHRSGIDCVNAHIAAIDDSRALVTWEENDVSGCGSDFSGYGCGKSNYTGTKFQIVDASASNQGAAFSSSDVFVSGDIARVGSKLCWPYVSMKWQPGTDDTWGEPKAAGPTVRKLSFACYNPGASSPSSSATGAEDGGDSVLPNLTATSSEQQLTITSTSVAKPTVGSSTSTVRVAPTSMSEGWLSGGWVPVGSLPAVAVATTFATVVV